MKIIMKKISCLLLIFCLAVPAVQILNLFYNVDTAMAASNVTSFGYKYKKGFNIDGAATKVYHKLGKGTAQLKVTTAKGVSSNNPSKCGLYKPSAVPGIHTHYGTVNVSKNGTLTFSKTVTASSNYYLKARGGSGVGNSGWIEVKGKVQNK